MYFSHANFQFRREDKCEEGVIHGIHTYSNFTFEKNYNNFSSIFLSFSFTTTFSVATVEKDLLCGICIKIEKKNCLEGEKEFRVEVRVYNG